MWMSNGSGEFKISPEPPGESLSLRSWDEITVEILLLADEEVEQAWEAFVSAWEHLGWWVETDHSGDPDEDAPEKITQSLREAIAELSTACRRSLQ